MRTNALYKELPNHWSCPSCLRSKSAIVRSLENHEQVGLVVEHHDHIRDYPNDTMREVHGTQWVKCIPQELTAHLNRIEAFTTGFSTVTICEDCNNADSSAKRITAAHRYFSFSPIEIRSFVKIASHRKHEVDQHRAKEMYSSAFKDFELRFRVAQELLMRANNGEYWLHRR